MAHKDARLVVLMGYSRKVVELLKKGKASEGSVVKLNWRGTMLEGTIMPKGESGDPDALVIKLKSGYNVGIDVSEIKLLTSTGEKIKLAGVPSFSPPRNTNLPSVSIIGTGGTIGTHVDYLTGGVFMSRTPEQILSTVPEIAQVVNVRSVLSPFIVASEDMNYKHWQEIAKLVAKELNTGARGVIVTHGTDFLHYTAAALSFMVQGTKPVALVGAQRSPDRGSFDGAMNLLAAAHYCAGDFGEVAVVMHGSSNDDYCLAMRGSKVRKMHSSRRDAFKPINTKPLAKIYPDGRLEGQMAYRKFQEGSVKLDASFEPKVAIVKAYPGADPAVLDWLVEKKYRGVIIEGSGLGHVPTIAGEGLKLGKGSWIPHVARACGDGMVVGVTSQTIYGRTNSHVYRNLRLLAGAGAVMCSDMLTETAFVKLGWLLGRKLKREQVKQLLASNLAGEINDRITQDEFY